MLRLYQGTMQGERTGGTGAAVAAPARAVDLRWSELLPLAPLCALIVLLGVYPYPVTSAIDPAAGVVLQTHTPAVPGIRR
jgi:NADH:ubiquinone oxidoreductase subunit 4 (subunit M)